MFECQMRDFGVVEIGLEFMLHLRLTLSHCTTVLLARDTDSIYA